MDDSIFWIDVEKVRPNPYQPRRNFNEEKLKELAESIRQYGVLQPLVVTRKEVEREDGGLATEYELIAGERRLRASKLAGISQVPVIIRAGTEEESNRIKLELAIIENIQREDLNSVDRARAFKQLAEEFGFKHGHIAQRIGKSREYVSNSIRLLSLPEDIIIALGEGKITEGHTRPLLMLSTRPEEQSTLFKDILYRRLSVREAERFARHRATDRVRKWTDELEPEMLAIERTLTDNLGTRVQIEKREQGGRLLITFFSSDDLRAILDRLEGLKVENAAGENQINGDRSIDQEEISAESLEEGEAKNILEESGEEGGQDGKEREGGGDDLYSVKNFTI